MLCAVLCLMRHLRGLCMLMMAGRWRGVNIGAWVDTMANLTQLQYLTVDRLRRRIPDHAAGGSNTQHVQSAGETMLHYSCVVLRGTWG